MGMGGTHVNYPPVSSTASVSNNNNDNFDILDDQPVIVHEAGEDPYYFEDHHRISIDRETESTMTESEVKHIIEIYNRNIDE